MKLQRVPDVVQIRCSIMVAFAAAVVLAPSGYGFDLPSDEALRTDRITTSVNSGHCGSREDIPQKRAPRLLNGRGSGGSPRGILTGCDDGSVIDMLVVYTAAARVAAGGTAAIEARIDAAIADTNTAFSNSLIDTSVQLVHSQEVAYAETGNSETDGLRLLDPDDGFLDEVHTLRDQYAADVAVLWVDALDTGGRVLAAMDVIGEGGFHEMRQAEGTLTMAHELGHNLGCVHDRPNAFPFNYFPYSYGYHEPGGAFHTIMAVVPPNTPLIPHFSNPDVSFGGMPTGIPVGMFNESHVAATIQLTRHVVANYRNAPMAGLPTVLHVDAAASPGGDGATWGTALNDLQDALCLARRSGGDVEEIWVKAGTYRPDRGTGLRIMAFVLEEGLGLYGGFAGTETMREQRNPAANVTTLSGDIGTAGISSDNSVHVVFAKGVDGSAILDGFTVANGNADTQSHFFDDVGGGIRIVSASPTIGNCVIVVNAATGNGGGVHNEDASATFSGCTFLANAATNGAGMGNDSGSAPMLDNCHFTSNSASFVGGGMHNNGTSPIVTGCRFSGNSAVYGGGVENFDNAAQFDGCDFDSNNVATQAGGAVHNNLSDSTFTQCTFVGNDAMFGGGMRSLDSNTSVSSSMFSGNTAELGGAVLNDGASDVSFSSCDLVMNMADTGGALYGFECSMTISDCVFDSNAATGGGGGVTLGGSKGQHFENCDFIENSASFGGALYAFESEHLIVGGGLLTGNTADDGGGIYLFNANPDVRGVLFDANDAGALALNTGVGGAMYAVAGSAPIVSSCTFFDNLGGYGGGAIRNQDSDSTIMNCRFIGNQCNTSGGAVENLASDVTMAGCLFSGNASVSGWGGAISNMADSNPEMSNLTISGNTAAFAGGGIANDATAPALWNSIAWGNTAGSFGVESQQIHHFAGTTSVAYSTIEGWTGGLGGAGNNGSNPLFSDADGADDFFGTLDDDARPVSGSPANDSGDNTLVAIDVADIDGDADDAERLPRDLDGSERFADDALAVDTGIADPPTYLLIVDRGAFEFSDAVDACATCAGDVNGDGLRDGADVEGFVACVLSGPEIGGGCACADVDGNATATFGDVSMFVADLIAGALCD